MTTAARPTWAQAKGGNEQGGTRIFGPSQIYSLRDIASHTTFKPSCSTRAGTIQFKGTMYLSNIRTGFVAKKRSGNLFAFDMPMGDGGSKPLPDVFEDPFALAFCSWDYIAFVLAEREKKAI